MVVMDMLHECRGLKWKHILEEIDKRNAKLIIFNHIKNDILVNHVIRAIQKRINPVFDLCTVGLTLLFSVGRCDRLHAHHRGHNNNKNQFLSRSHHFHKNFYNIII